MAGPNGNCAPCCHERRASPTDGWPSTWAAAPAARQIAVNGRRAASAARARLARRREVLMTRSSETIVDVGQGRMTPSWPADQTDWTSGMGHDRIRLWQEIEDLMSKAATAG